MLLYTSMILDVNKFDRSASICVDLSLFPLMDFSLGVSSRRAGATQGATCSDTKRSLTLVKGVKVPTIECSLRRLDLIEGVDSRSWDQV